MNNNKGTIGLIIVAVLFVIGNSSTYILTEGKQAIVTEFGKPIGEPITNAGIHFKKPFVHKVRFVDKRILNWDGYPNQIPTKDKKYIKVDTTARWRVVDALKFIQTVQNEQGAKARLDTILDGHTRDIISGHNLVEAVRNSDKILAKIEEKKAEIEAKKAKGEFILEEEIGGEIVSITVGREQLSQMIVEQADKELNALGIQLIDLQLRRISYEESVERKVYERMISERQRIAQKIRSIGKGEKAKIEGRLGKDLKDIESQAYRTAEVIRGKAEATATAIYAKSLSRDAKFYEFIKTMESYKKALKPGTKFLFSSDAEFFKYLK
ncbi:MAG: protease modulator HflC [Halobacteriovoraceae bacterium]|jgi:modulator of FtsH protease HflC|nr:protease modulator HflC [Halobacteriovoraceae bacterium]